jgi:hypothetical protein
VASESSVVHSPSVNRRGSLNLALSVLLSSSSERCTLAKMVISTRPNGHTSDTHTIMAHCIGDCQTENV